MSWREKIERDFIIVTGDGELYFPNWMESKFQIEFNASLYEYPGIAGTRVSKQQPKGTVYAIEIYFQGEDHLDVSQKFKISSYNTNPWAVSHPLYGQLTVQPVSLRFDDTGFGVTKITGTVIETITDIPPNSTQSRKQQARQTSLDTTEILSQYILPEFTVEQSVIVSEQSQKIYDRNALQITDQTRLQQYYNTFSELNEQIINATTEPASKIRAFQSFINFPFITAQSVKGRLQFLLSELETAATFLTTRNSKDVKKLYELQGGLLVQSMGDTTIEASQTDFASRKEVLETSQLIINGFNTYIEKIDAISSSDSTSKDAYSPDPTAVSQLYSLINTSISALFEIAISARQEREIILPNDTNVVLLTHELYELASNDNIDLLLASNDIGIDELWQLEKGKKITYYV